MPSVSTSLDCGLFGDLFGTERMRAVFDSRALLQAWLDVEVALAEAEADAGVIPAAAVEGIRAAARAERFDLDELREGIRRSQHPLVPTIEGLSEAAGKAGRYVHWGATTQDIMDTATVLQIRASLDLVERALAELIEALAEQARHHARTSMPGRTHGQHAVPTTFGLVVGVWLDELGRTQARLAECRGRVLVVQLGGAAGTLASLGSRGRVVREAFARHLELGLPPTPWHSARDGAAELVSTLGILAGTLEKIALRIIRLQATEIAEVGEPDELGNVGSSTMPQKRNPMMSEYVAASCKLIRGLVPVMQSAMVGEHERDMASWATEWLIIPRAFVLTDAALSHLAEIVRGLDVDERRMAANLELTNGGILAERVMLALADHVGRLRAHHLIAEVARDAERRGIHLLTAICDSPEVAPFLTMLDLDKLRELGSYLGEAPELAHAAAERAASQVRVK